MTSTVRLSRTSAPLSEPARLAQRAGGLPLSARSNVKRTASALNGVPSWNLTFGRSLKRTRVGDMTSYDVASAGLTCIFSSSVSSPSSMLKYPQAPGAVVSRLGSSDTGSVGRTIVSVPPRFWAPADGTSETISARTSRPSSRRERMGGLLVFRREQLGGERGRRVERVQGAVALAHERGDGELVGVAVGIEGGQ